MMHAVVLGLAGVLQPVESLWQAEVEAACGVLSERGERVARFREAALAGMRRGEWPGSVRTALDAGLVLTFDDRCRICLAARAAVPDAPAVPPREPLRALRSRHRLVFLDAGPGPRMETWLERLQAADLAERRLWTDDLGGLARPPRPLAFHWLANRLGHPPDDCLYVPGTAPLRDAALAAGWRVWGEVPRDPALAIDLEALVTDLEGVEEPQQVTRS